MATTLRDFISQRDAEIRVQIKALKAEQKELQVAKNALDAQGDTSQAPATGPTIKDMARDVLADATKGMTSGEVLVAIAFKYDREIERTSLSPQLSRLKDDGELTLSGEKWFTKANYTAWEEGLVRDVGRQLEDNAIPGSGAVDPEGMFD